MRVVATFQPPRRQRTAANVRVVVVLHQHSARLLVLAAACRLVMVVERQRMECRGLPRMPCQRFFLSE